MGQRPRMGVNLPQSYKGYFSNPLSGSIPNMNPFVGAIKKDQSTRMWHQNVVPIKKVRPISLDRHWATDRAGWGDG